jgi:hypothetical protein
VQAVIGLNGPLWDLKILREVAIIEKPILSERNKNIKYYDENGLFFSSSEMSRIVFVSRKVDSLR